MKDILDTLEGIFRVTGAIVLSLFTMLIAVFITLFTAGGNGLMWLAEKLVGKYDTSDEKV